MGSINWGRVFLGGLLGGVVLNILGWLVYGLYLAKDWEAAMQALGRPMQETTGSMVFIIVMNFIGAIAAVWFYAAIRPRFGPGPKTAALAGFAFWFIGALLPTLWWDSLGLFPQRLLTIDVGVGLILWIIATIVGAWPYKE